MVLYIYWSNRSRSVGVLARVSAETLHLCRHPCDPVYSTRNSHLVCELKVILRPCSDPVHWRMNSHQYHEDSTSVGRHHTCHRFWQTNNKLMTWKNPTLIKCLLYCRWQSVPSIWTLQQETSQPWCHTIKTYASATLQH